MVRDYLDACNWFNNQDTNNFWCTIVNYSEHVTVMSCVMVILNNRNPENMYDTIFIIVAHRCFLSENL